VQPDGKGGHAGYFNHLADPPISEVGPSGHQDAALLQHGSALIGGYGLVRDDMCQREPLTFGYLGNVSGIRLHRTWAVVEAVRTPAPSDTEKSCSLRLPRFDLRCCHGAPIAVPTGSKTY